VTTALLAGLLLAGAARVAAQESPARLPYRLGPIHYFAESDNPVARWQQAWQANGDEAPQPGDLATLLRQLQISESSQMLVFARNARQSHQISPDNPRAIYFNDEISVAWTPGAKNFEISVIDPLRGPVFYLASAAEVAPRETEMPDRRNPGPLFHRTESCLACHVSEQTRQVPGYLLRSMFTTPEGKPQSGLPLVDHTTPYDQRWGGWYVTGERLPPRHRGNLATAAARKLFETGSPAIPLADDLRLRATARHLQETSDVVALLVHDHQTRFQTLLTRLRYEHEFGRPLETLDEFVRTMLLWNEPPLPGPVTGRDDYRAWFETAGPAAYRPLRQLDLQTRLLQKPLSWLVATPQFQSAPSELRWRIQIEALRLVFEGCDTPTALSDEDRRQLWDELLPQYTAPGVPTGQLPQSDLP
jgi:hypothetical protein